ncbi:hypothetical protein XI07_15085 [Bradyrhizobium sp. CCBAU 11445]|nr:hypothetical protein [Bradyrhizobium sp. CCBAU 21359]MDA9483321.1 hypothetical protein [Bradyrhizobium sp. CCBAU 11445]MDA9519037.1 hypothetical protein [Bradyrhizobium sp. CCBAU 11434]
MDSKPDLIFGCMDARALMDILPFGAGGLVAILRKCRGLGREGMRTQGILLLVRQVAQLADLGEGRRETRDRRPRKTTPVGDIAITQTYASIFEAAQDIECARNDLYHVPIFRTSRRPLLHHQFLRSTPLFA